MRAIGSDICQMRRALVLFLVLGCGGKDKVVPADADPDAAPDAAPDALVIPVFRNPVDLPDDQLALSGAEDPRRERVRRVDDELQRCHGLTRQQLRYWRVLSDTAMTTCLTDLAVSSRESARTMIECIRAMPELPQSDFQTKKLGIYSSATQLPWFSFAVQRLRRRRHRHELGTELVSTRSACRAAAAPPSRSRRRSSTSSPSGSSRGLPRLDADAAAGPAADDVRLAGVAPTSRRTSPRWRRRAGARSTRRTMMAMFGCGAATDPKQCLPTAPLGADAAVRRRLGRARPRPAARARRRRPTRRRSGRAARPTAGSSRTASQNVAGSYVIDLQRDGRWSRSTRHVRSGFFPDNSGFVFQGGPRNTCAQSVLTSNPTSDHDDRAGVHETCDDRPLPARRRACSGGDYFAIDGQFVSDDGGHTATLRDPDANFGSNGHARLHPDDLRRHEVRREAAGHGAIAVRGRHRAVAVGQARRSRASPARTSASSASCCARSTRRRRHVVRDHGARDRALLHLRRQARLLVRRALDRLPPLRDAGRRGRARLHRRRTIRRSRRTCTQGAANMYLMDLRPGVPVRITNMRPASTRCSRTSAPTAGSTPRSATRRRPRVHGRERRRAARRVAHRDRR